MLSNKRRLRARLAAVSGVFGVFAAMSATTIVPARAEASPPAVEPTTDGNPVEMPWEVFELLGGKRSLDPTGKVGAAKPDPTQKPRERVIVGLDTGFVPEGDLGDASLVAEQRARITKVAEGLLGELAPGSFDVAYRARFVPALVLEVDPVARVALEKSSAVASVHESARFLPTQADPDDWDAYANVGVDVTRSMRHDGSGASVAVIDTGIDQVHEDLRGKVVAEACWSQETDVYVTDGHRTRVWEEAGPLPASCPDGVEHVVGPGAAAPCFSQNDAEVAAALFEVLRDVCSHGTSTAAIAAGRRGVAPGAGIVGVQAISVQCVVGVVLGLPVPSCSEFLDEGSLLEVTEWVFDLRDEHNIAALNMSFGLDGERYADVCGAGSPVSQAFSQLWLAGVMPVASSGNDSDAGGIGSPACMSGVVGVGASISEPIYDRSGEVVGFDPDFDIVLPFSNSAPTLDLLAPGAINDVATLGGENMLFAGTSAAAPMVAGAAAVLSGIEPSAPSGRRVQIMADTGRSVLDRRNNMTRPRIDVMRAATRLADETRTGTGIATGDFDHDGYADLAVGAPGEGIGNESGAGALQVIYGSGGGLGDGRNRLFHQDTAGVPGQAESDDGFSDALATGDFNRDGYADVAVGVAHEDLGRGLRDAGIVHVLYGSAGGVGTTGTQLIDRYDVGPRADARLGAALGAADFNNDGFSDLAIGAPGATVGGAPNAGSATIVFGARGGLAPNSSTTIDQNTAGVPGAAESGDQFGFALAVGDFDHDRNLDLAVGVPGERVSAQAQAGAVNVLAGPVPAALDRSSLFHQNSPGVDGVAQRNDRFGAALAASDFKGYGFAGLAVGAPGESLGADESVVSAGAVHVLPGGNPGLSGDGDQLFVQGRNGVGGNPQAAARLGASLDARDISGDGRADLLVGAPGHDVGGSRGAGVFFTFVGQPAGLAAAGVQTQEAQMRAGADRDLAAEAGDANGTSLATGDFDHDGGVDRAVGAPGETVRDHRSAGAVVALDNPRTGAVLWHQDVGAIAGSAEEGDHFGGRLPAGPPGQPIPGLGDEEECEWGPDPDNPGHIRNCFEEWMSGDAWVPGPLPQSP